MATSMFAGDNDLRQRLISQGDPEYNPTGSAYDKIANKVFLARRKKPDSTIVRICEATLFIGTVAFALYAYCYFDTVHFHIVKAYAHAGYAAAQHQTGQRYLNGKGVEQHKENAMHWFKKAADQGHAHASYNLAIGHLKGMKTALNPGEAHTLIQHAAAHGVPEAKRVLGEICSRGKCDT